MSRRSAYCLSSLYHLREQSIPQVLDSDITVIASDEPATRSDTKAASRMMHVSNRVVGSGLGAAWSVRRGAYLLSTFDAKVLTK